MSLSTIFLAIALIAVVGGIASFMAMVAHISQRGVKINWFLIKLYMPRYVSRYRALTIQETGRPGQLFYGFIIGMNTALVAGIAGLALQ